MDGQRPTESAIPRQVKKTAVVLALATVRALANGARLFGQLVFVVIALPLVFLAKHLIKPILLHLYRWTFPFRLALKRIAGPMRTKILYPLTTRPVASVLIGIITVVVTSNSLLAKEVRIGTQSERTILARLLEPSNPTDTFTASEVLPNNATPDGTVSAADTLAEAPDPDTVTNDALASPALTDTTIAGQPRREVVHYSVEGGDTLSTIAEKFGVSTRTLRWANNLTDTDYIKPGQDLTIPPVSGVLHHVKNGETLAGIAAKYSANLETILEFNHLALAEAIQPDQTLVIPGGEIAPAAPAYTPRSIATNPRDSGPATPPPSANPGAGNGFLWPTTSHHINQGYKYFHRALDMDGNVGTPIYAADSGRVTEVKYERYGYGYHVVVDHGGGIKTLYAHAAKIYVKPGDSIRRGQTIAIVGMTGRTTGPHLHFEVFVNGSKVNPFGYIR